MVPFWKDTLVKGKPTRIRCVEIGGQSYTISGGSVSTIALEDEWYDDVSDPEALLDSLRRERTLGVDLFTFWQRVPDCTPRFAYYHEWEYVAALPADHEEWWTKRLKPRVRSQLRKAEKDGLVLRHTTYDDEFVRGMAAIFNEARVRQGRPFWHYGKDVETIRQQFARYIHREHMIGAYFDEQLVGLVMLGDAQRYGVTGQIISSLAHRDKATNVALISKSVEVCQSLGLGYLVYLHWSDDSLGEFKRRSGFERTRVPRYFVPVTARGHVALATGLHRGWRARVPSAVTQLAKRMRAQWYGGATIASGDLPKER